MRRMEELWTLIRSSNTVTKVNARSVLSLNFRKSLNFMRRIVLIASLLISTNPAFPAEKGAPSESIQAPALVYWASLGRTAIVERLLEEKANSNGVDAEGWSALQAAPENGHLEIVKLLVEAGASLNYISAQGSALQYAVRAKQQAVVSYLRSRGAK